MIIIIMIIIIIIIIIIINNNDNALLSLSQEILILDEADRLLDLGFEATYGVHVVAIIY